MTHCEQVLQLLSDREPHSHHELYALHVIAHSRVADLRAQGHTVRCWREGDTSYYQLESELTERDSLSERKLKADAVTSSHAHSSAVLVNSSKEAGSLPAARSVSSLEDSGAGPPPGSWADGKEDLPGDADLLPGVPAPEVIGQLALGVAA